MTKRQAPSRRCAAWSQLAGELRHALAGNDLEAFGEILHESWVVKKTMADGVSTPQIDDWYEPRARQRRARRQGRRRRRRRVPAALRAAREAHAGICRALPELRPVPFRLEPQGSKIIYVEEAARD